MIIVDAADVARVPPTLDAVLDLDARLPAPVFRAEFAEYCWMEFEEILDTPFFSAVTSLAAAHGDRELVARFDDYAAVFSPADDVAAYHAFLDTDLRRECGDAFAIAGTSGQWVFVGFRSIELTVGASMQPGSWPIVKGLRYHTFDTALDLAAAPFRRNPPAGYLEAFVRNYGARSWKIDRYVEG